MDDRQNAIRVSVALKAAVDYWQGANASHAQVIESATLFEQWLAEREGAPGAAPQVAVTPTQAPSPTPQTWTCPDCGSPMKKRTARDETEFFGCSQYPTCRGTRRIDGSTSKKAQARTN